TTVEQIRRSWRRVFGFGDPKNARSRDPIQRARPIAKKKGRHQAMLDFYRSDKSNATHNILSLVSSYTQLKKVGREYLGTCPLHSEKTPSFRVNADRGLFYCFGCGTGGDAIRFVELVEGVDFKKALQILGMAKGSPQPRRISLRNEISEWTNRQIQKMNDRLRS